MTTTTTAEQVSETMGNDGQVFRAEDGRSLDDVCKAMSGRVRTDGFDAQAYDFADGSTITISGGAWDLGYAGCYCWQGAGHTCGAAN